MTKYHECPICGNDKFHEGPRGGMAQNVKCSKCESILNITPFGIEIIEEKQLENKNEDNHD